MINFKDNNKLAWVAVFVWLAVIFGFSAMPGSGEQHFSWSYFLERKSLHVIEYFILSVLLYRALVRDIVSRKAVWLASAVALLYAVSDEWHQTFVFGREGTPRDVVVDLIGIFLAAIFTLRFKQFEKKKKWQKKKNKK